jgi:membrane-bound lytic murein transglycosylase D
MQRYLPYILSQIQEKGLPAELTLLPVVESALDPYAFSPYGASGLWQFMRPTAKQYGLTYQ